MLAQGYLIVGEFDDEPEHFGELVRTDSFALRACHCLQTTNDVMAEALRPFNRNVGVFPNHVAAFRPPERRRSRIPRTDRPTIFFGALNREADWAPILPELNRVLDSSA